MPHAPPLLVIPAFGKKGDSQNRIKAKMFASSLLRGLFSGSILILRNNEMPLFKVEKRSINEVYLPGFLMGENQSFDDEETEKMLRYLCNHVDVAPDQWIILSSSSSLTLRNIDHLFPSDGCKGFPPQEADLQFAACGSLPGQLRADCATASFFAARGKCLPAMWDQWNAVSASAPRSSGTQTSVVWRNSLRELGFKTKFFETGAVTAPDQDMISWNSLRSAAVVTLPQWDPASQLNLLQALYWGTILGGNDGMILNLMEA